MMDPNIGQINETTIQHWSSKRFSWTHKFDDGLFRLIIAAAALSLPACGSAIVSCAVASIPLAKILLVCWDAGLPAAHIDLTESTLVAIDLPEIKS